MNKILSNINIVVTRAEHQVGGDVKLLQELGATVIQFPTIKVQPVTDYSGFDRILSDFGSINYLIFTSANTVIFFVKRIKELQITINYRSIIIIAVGKKTAKTCKENNIKIDLMPDIYTSEGIIELMKKEQVISKTVLIPCSLIAKDDLKEGLENLGLKVIKVPIYGITLPTDEEIKNNMKTLENFSPDLCIFTSPSTYKNYLRIFNINNPQIFFKDIKIAAIGTITQYAIEKSGVKVDIIPNEFNMISLINSIKDYYSNN
jgi:uroporphyrinogen-III synthase